MSTRRGRSIGLCPASIDPAGRCPEDWRMADAHVIKPLTPETYPAWLALAQKHNGVWGGCY